MYPLHDKDLDRLSRNAAEHYEMDFGSSGSGWEQLEKRLDQELPPPRNRRRFLFWLFFIVVTTGSALIGLLISSQPAQSFAVNNIRAMAPVYRMQGDVPRGRIGDGAVDGVRETDKSSVNKVADDHSVDNRVDNKVVEPVDQPAIAIDNGSTSVSPNNSTIKQTTTFPTPHLNKKHTPTNRRKTPNQASKATDLSINDNTPNQVSKTTNLSINDDQVSKATDLSLATNDDQSYKQINDLGNKTIDSVSANTTAAQPIDSSLVSTDSTAAEKADKPKIPHTYKQKWEFGITAGPDGSMVNFGPLFKAGYNFGVQIGYRFNDRWSVNTGLIYTRKYYQADSNTFHAPAHSQISYVKLDALKGFCAMFDIPLNVRYDITFNDKRRLFASAGASTYLMNRQYYDAWFRTQNNPDQQTKPWDSKTSSDYFKKNYLFSVLNLSVGYERTLSKHISIQAEPYMKIPLTGMGYGTMKIGSYGMFFSLKYHPTSRTVQKK